MRCLIVFLALLLGSCANHTPEQPDTSTPSVQAPPAVVTEDTLNPKGTKVTMTADTTSLILEFLTPLPDTIEGCSGLYAMDPSFLKEGMYLFATNVSQFGIIRLNGRDIYLQLVRQKGTPEGELLFRGGGGYEVRIKTQRTKQVDEVGTYEGTLQILYKGKQRTYKIWGELGC
jgi:hypothetical protein